MACTAKAAALRFLKIRPCSVGELTEKLEAKGFSAEEIQAAIVDLKASGLLDDRAFTKSWIIYRLARPFGFRRIIQELKAKGIGPELIDEALADIQEAYQPEDAALDLAKRRWQRWAAVDPLKKRKQVMDFLLRRGFEAGVVMKVLKKLK